MSISISSANVRGQMPRSDGATDAGEERASASGVTARRGYLDRSVGILSSRELCIAIGILADLNDLVRRLGSGAVLDRAGYEDLIQWFTVEFPSAGTDKFAIVKPAQRVDDFCSAVLASCGERDAVERAVRAKSSDGIGFGGIQEELREWRIECHSDLISSPNVPDHLLPLAFGTKACSAGDVPKVPKAWELSASVCSHFVILNILFPPFCSS